MHRLELQHVVLDAVQALLGGADQHRQLGLVMSRPDMLQDAAASVAFLDDLDGGRPGGGLHPPHKRTHRGTLPTLTAD